MIAVLQDVAVLGLYQDVPEEYFGKPGVLAATATVRVAVVDAITTEAPAAEHTTVK
jgi:hypothetical protein